MVYHTQVKNKYIFIKINYNTTDQKQLIFNLI